jgi:hypothetical protein
MKLISFYCDSDNSNFYTKCAERLKKQCDDIKMPSVILHENYGDSWIDNVRAKPLFLLKMLNQLEEDFIWLDVDCSIHKKIDFEFSVDWMIDIRNDGNPHDYVHLVKNNSSNKEFIIKWINKIDENKGGSHSAFIEIHKDLKFDIFHSGYVSLFLSDVQSKKKYFHDN